MLMISCAPSHHLEIPGAATVGKVPNILKCTQTVT